MSYGQRVRWERLEMPAVPFATLQDAVRVPLGIDPSSEAEHGLYWHSDLVRARSRREPRRSSGRNVREWDLRIDLGVAGQGWVELDLNIDGDQERVVGSAVFGDALGYLMTAARMSVVDARAAWCSWNDEPGETHIVFINDAKAAATTVELWRDDSEIVTSPRTHDLIGRWRGPTSALARELANAVSGLLVQVGPENVVAKWGYRAPIAEMGALNDWLTGRQTGNGSV